LIASYLSAMFEHRTSPLLSGRRFAARQLRFTGVAVAILAGSLAIGLAGYMLLAPMGPVDAFLNAAMIMGGMGPVDVLTNDAAKIFAGVYALYSGIALLGSMAILLAPAVHRMLHALHLDASDGGDQPSERRVSRHVR
jgi:hypothetical protein